MPAIPPSPVVTLRLVASPRGPQPLVDEGAVAAGVTFRARSVGRPPAPEARAPFDWDSMGGDSSRAGTRRRTRPVDVTAPSAERAA